jgi:formate dehydrogenase major subunit
MRAAMEMGTQIPKLCATDMVDAFRLLPAVSGQVEGPRRRPASCTTPAMENLVVSHTQNERLEERSCAKGVMGSTSPTIRSAATATRRRSTLRGKDMARRN